MANPDPSAQAAQINQAVERIAADETMYAMKHRSNNSRTGIAGTVMNPYSDATIRFDENTKTFLISHSDSDIPKSDIKQAIVTLRDIWMADLKKLATDRSKLTQAIESILHRQQLIMDDPAHPGEDKGPEIEASGSPVHYYDVGNDRDRIDYWSNIQDKVEQLHESAVIHKRVEQEYEVWVNGRKYDTVKTRAEAEQVMLTAQVNGVLDRVIWQESLPRQADAMPRSSAAPQPAPSPPSPAQPPYWQTGPIAGQAPSGPLGGQSYVPPLQSYPAPQPAPYYPAPYYPAPYYPPRPPVMAQQNQNATLAIVLEIVCGLFGLFGIGWLVSGNTQTGIILLVGGLVWGVVWVLIAIFTLGIGFLCIGPINLAIMITSTIILNNRLRQVPPAPAM